MKNEIDILKEKMKELENALKIKDRDFAKLNTLIIKLLEKVDNPEPSELEVTENDSVQNLETTFLNPSSEMQCDDCDFVAKNITGLKIHKKSKHTKSLKFHCDDCDLETNNKKFFNDHRASKCTKIIMCNFNCGESFDNKEEENDHVTKSHTKAKKYECEMCEFKTSIKKLFNDHKASKCLKTIACDFGCGQSFESLEEVNEHLKTIHKC